MLFHKQRVASLSKLLGRSYNEEAIVQALQGLSSSESVDFRAVLFPDMASSCDGSSISGEASEVSGTGTVRNCSAKWKDDGNSSSVVAVEQLLTELQSVAIEWKSLRTATNCSCAIPFEQHSKKVW